MNKSLFFLIKELWLVKVPNLPQVVRRRHTPYLSLQLGYKRFDLLHPQAFASCLPKMRWKVSVSVWVDTWPAMAWQALWGVRYDMIRASHPAWGWHKFWDEWSLSVKSEKWGVTCTTGLRFGINQNRESARDWNGKGKRTVDARVCEWECRRLNCSLNMTAWDGGARET